MRIVIAAAFLAVAAILVSTASVSADKKDEKKKEVTLKGLVACTKCELGKSKTCETVIVVKGKDKKDVLYYFDADSHKKYHDDICTGAKKGSVTGIVKEVEKKKIISVKKVAYD